LSAAKSGAACLGFPDFAALNPGYAHRLRANAPFSHARTLLQKPSPKDRNPATLLQIAPQALSLDIRGCVAMVRATFEKSETQNA
jgi:hypothetical protein